MRPANARLLDGLGIGLTLLGLTLEIGLHLYWWQLRLWIMAYNQEETVWGLV